MQELRGFIFDQSGNLYIANAYKKLSQILQFKPAGNGTYAASSTTTPWVSDNLNHPFALAIDGAQNIYATNQDSGNSQSLEVTYYSPTGTPLGVFIPNPNAQTPGPNLVQIRGLAWDGVDTWYLADEKGNGTGAVYRYDNSGNYKGSFAVADPIHLLYQNNVLYIGTGGNMVYYYTVAAGQAQPLIANLSPGITINEVSGLVIPGDGYIYIGSRGNLQVLRFKLASSTQATGGEVFFDKLPDFPEFVGLI